MKARIGKQTFSAHPLLLFFWCFLFLTGRGDTLFPSLTALALHESGHALLAFILRVEIGAFEITPFGGVITLRAPEKLSPRRGFLLAAAGPLFSLLGCLVTPYLYERGVFGFSFACSFARANLTLLLVNLMPVLPLDGGKMAEAAIRRFFPSVRPARVLYRLGALLGAALCLLSLIFALKGQLVLSPLFAGMYLFYIFSLEERHGAARYVTEWIARRQKLNARDTLPVELLAAGPDMPAKSLLKKLTPGRYHLIFLLSKDGMKLQGVIDEAEYCQAVLGGGEKNLAEIGARMIG